MGSRFRTPLFASPRPLANSVAALTVYSTRAPIVVAYKASLRLKQRGDGRQRSRA
jgi:hypothetical protein